MRYFRKIAPMQDIERDSLNTLQAVADEIGVTARTLQRWMRQTYTARTPAEGRRILRPRVEINESQTARQGRTILRKIYDANGLEIWHAHRTRKH